MSILLTGGTGQTSSRVACLLQSSNRKVILASRRPSSEPPTTTSRSVKFDWTDPSTYENPFNTDLGHVESAYLVPPGLSPNVFSSMKPFIDFAIEKGVKRFVLISTSSTEPDGPSAGKIHQYLIDSGVDYFVVRPSWLFENNLTLYAHSIKLNNEFITACGDGKIGFVAADDIADLVAEALLAEKSYNTDLIITGPELLSYDEVAEIFSLVLGRSIKHTRYSVEDIKKRYMSFGVPEDFSQLSALAESRNASGFEEKVFSLPPSRKRTGKRTLREFVEQNKNAWIA